jgi:TolB protein
MTVLSIRSRLCRALSATALWAMVPGISAQLSLAPAGAAAQSAAAKQPQERLRSRIFIYDLRDGTSHMVYTADAVWEAPNWSPDGKYLISNSGGGIYKLVLKQDGAVEAPQRLAIPAEYRCNNDKAISPDGRKLGFSATLAPHEGSQVFLADAHGSDIKLLAEESPSYFHGWSPDSTTLAFVAQRGGSGQYDVYRVPAAGGPEQRLNSSPSQEDGPDNSPDGKWIYVNSTRSGKEAIWRFPAEGAGPKDTRAEMVVSDGLEDWFPHISPDGSKMVYIGYPAGTPTHNPRDVRIELKLVTISNGKVGTTQKTLVQGTGGQGSLNVTSWAPDSMRFAYVTHEPLP